jgi:HlyD family secretion protein
MNPILHLWQRQSPSRQRASLFVSGAVLLSAGILIVSFWRAASSETDQFSRIPLTEVLRGPLAINAVESGTVRPRRQIVLKNETEDPAAILFIVPEGQRVKAGELLIELDVTQLENDVVERRIRVQNDEADLIHAQENLKVVENQCEADLEQAELDYQFAQQDLQKYLEGEYPKLVKEAEAKITLAEEELIRAQEDLRWSKVLREQEFISQSELEQDELAAKKGQLNLELARADLELLKEYTYPRQVDQLNSDVKQTQMALERTQRLARANLAQAKAQLSAREAELAEEQSRLQRLEIQLSKAKIHAPIDGLVLYATSVREDWRRDAEPIAVGTIVREREEIIYLPTDAEFSVDIKITEVDLAKIKPGLPARVLVDAIPDRTLSGTVTEIAQLPDSQSRFLNPNLKLYETVIELSNTDAPLRNGMSCRVEITVDHYPDALFVPIQTVTRVAGQPVVYVADASGVVKPREVTIGLDNSRFIHITGGLEQGERILLAPPLTSSTRETTPAESDEPPNDRPEPAPADEPEPEDPPEDAPDLDDPGET